MENVVPVALQHLRATDIIRMAGLAVASQGQHYYRVGAVHKAQRRGGHIAGIVAISQATNNGTPQLSRASLSASPNDELTTSYSVEVEVQSSTSWSSHCACGQDAIPVSISNGTEIVAQTQPICVHAATLLYQWIARPMSFQTDATPLAIAPIQHMQPYVTEQERAATMTYFLSSREHPAVMRQRGPTPLNTLTDILTQLGLSDLRGIAREYDITTNGLSKQQLVEAIHQALQHPESVRHVASTLEKPQRQLLAALALAGGAIMDDDLRSLFERFKLGQASQLQGVLLTLQNKGLLFRTSLNSSPQQRFGFSGALLDVGWYVPQEIRNALHVFTPITRYDIEEHANEIANHHDANPEVLLTTLLLVARRLQELQLTDDDLLEHAPLRSQSSHVRPVGTPTGDGSIALAPPDDEPSSTLVDTLHLAIKRPKPLLHFALRLLRRSGMIQKSESTGTLHTLPDISRLLLGPHRFEVLRDLFTLWLTHPSYDEMYELRTHNLRLRNRATSQNQPLIHAGELEAENSEARQSLLGLLSQTATDQWIHANAFARFLYRIDPLFLQRRQRLFSPPHWWIEQERERPLHPQELTDWLKAEFHYFMDLLRGPLYWFGLCDLALASDGRILAFRLTPVARLFLSGSQTEDEAEVIDDVTHSLPEKKHHGTPSEDAFEVVDARTIDVVCSSTNWDTVEILERWTEPTGIHRNRLRYHVTPSALARAMSKGYPPEPLLGLLTATETLAPPTEASERMRQMRSQLERWLAHYGRVRIYTGATLLETADTVIMRELSATTSLDAQVIQMLHPTLSLLKKTGAEQVIEELKRRGQTPLLHIEELDGTY